MAAGSRTIKIVIDGETRGLEAASARGEKAVTSWQDKLSQFDQTATRASLAIVATAAIVGKRLVGMASAAEQSIGAVNSVFGRSADQVQQWAQESAESVGLSANAYREMATVIGAQLKNMGVSQDQVAGTTNDLIKRGADLAAMFGGTTADAVSALSALLRGETDPIERYGVSIREADIAARMAAQGTDQLTGAQAKNARTAAIMALLTEQTADATGQFARESDTAAGKAQRASARWEDLQTQIGERLLPIFSGFMDFLSSTVFPLLEKHEALVTNLVVSITAMAAAYLVVSRVVRVAAASIAAVKTVMELVTNSTGRFTGAWGAMTTAARAATLAMGAIGVVLTIAGIAMAAFSGKSAEAEARQQQLADAGKRVGEAIAEQNGVITENIRQMAAKEAADAGLLKLARELGISQKQVVDAILNEGDARAQLAGKTREHRDQVDGLAKGVLGLAGVEEESYSKAAKLQEGVDALTGGINDQREATADATAATQDNTDATQQQIGAIEELIEAQRKAAGVILDQRDAERQLADTIARADEAINQNGATLDVNTQKGRDNQEALDGIVTKTFDVIAAMSQNGAANDQLIAKMTTARAEFVRVAVQMGLTEGQANALADQLGLIPGTYAATVTANTKQATNAVSAFQTYLNNLISKPYHVQVTADMPAGGGGLIGSPVPPRATGGPVQAGRTYLVGERGPELLVMPNSSGGNVVPNHQLGGGGTSVFVTIDGQQLQGRIDRTVRENNRAIRRGATSGTGRSR